MSDITDKIDSGGVKVKENVYSTYKIFSHPQVVEKLNKSERVSPILIQIMPQNLCSQNCSFCSYRRDGNKNNELFDDREYMSLEKMLEVLDNCNEIGVNAFEITGGGEPSIYKYFKQMVSKMIEYNFDISIVSNGTGLKEEYIKIMSPNLLWARISIDAGNVEDYCRIRECDEKHWKLAWKAVENLAKYGSHKEYTLGTGYVVTPDNYLGILDGVRLMKEHGSHNVRISAAFTEKNLEYYSLGSIGKNVVIETAKELSAKAKQLYEDDKFKVYNLFDERIKNIEDKNQNYDYCMEKEVVCVIGGDEKVYTCCSLAFNKRGLIGSIKEQSFKDLWFSEKTTNFFRKHNPKNICNIMCLYQLRNEAFLENRYKQIDIDMNLKHKNFI